MTPTVSLKVSRGSPLGMPLGRVLATLPAMSALVGWWWVSSLFAALAATLKAAVTASAASLGAWSGWALAHRPRWR